MAAEAAASTSGESGNLYDGLPFVSVSGAKLLQLFDLLVGKQLSTYADLLQPCST